MRGGVWTGLLLRLTVPLGGLYIGATRYFDDAHTVLVEVGLQFKLGPRVAR